jgi:hypothetical protein
MEQVKEVKPVRRIYICDECKIGEMKFTGTRVYTTIPPLYPHICDSCGYQIAFTVSYPYIDWV